MMKLSEEHDICEDYAVVGFQTTAGRPRKRSIVRKQEITDTSVRNLRLCSNNLKSEDSVYKYSTATTTTTATTTARNMFYTCHKQTFYSSALQTQH